MAPWGKAHSAVSDFRDRAKGHILWAGHKYRQGMHLASKANSLYQTGKQIASIFMPELQQLGLDNRLTQGFSALDSMRDSAISRHQDVLDRISENSQILGKMRQAQTLAQPYIVDIMRYSPGGGAGWIPYRNRTGEYFGACVF